MKLTKIILLFLFSVILFVYFFIIRPINQPSYSEHSQAAPLELPHQNHFYLKLATHWSPIIYQQTHQDNPLGDFITRFDYDGDFDAYNNWENYDKYPLKAYVYYSVVESQSHYFIYYGFFHPRDWEVVDNGLSSHENDLESNLFVVKKNGSEFGELQLIETQAHADFFAYSNDENLKQGTHAIDGSITLDGTHPKIIVPIGGHGNYAIPTILPDGDGIVYKYKGKADVPHTYKGHFTEEFGYDLITIDSLWERRDLKGKGTPFRSFGEMGTDNYSWINGAQVPWIHDDYNDGPVVGGDILSDPIYMIDTHFDGLGEFSHEYIHHPYFTHKVSLNAIQLDLESSTGQIYLEVLNQNKLYWSIENWIQEMNIGQPYTLPTTARRYISAPEGTSIQINIKRKAKHLFDFETDLGYVRSTFAKSFINTLTHNKKARMSATIEINKL